LTLAIVPEGMGRRRQVQREGKKKVVERGKKTDQSILASEGKPG